MKLYNLPPAPNPRRVRIFLAEKGVEVPTVDLDITAQCALLLGKNTDIPIPSEHENLTRWWASVTSRPTARA